MKKTFTLITLCALLAVLLASISEMPSLGDTQNPSYNEATNYYVDNAARDTKAANIVASIITDYRAFDTLGETTVLFTGIAAVISVLSVSGKAPETKKEEAK